MSVKCEICGKEFKNTQGLRGHKNFVHANTGNGIGQSVTQQTTQQLLSSNSSVQVTAEQRLSQLEDRFTRLEHITVSRETDEMEKILGITDIPLIQRVAQLTEQLSKLTEQLKSEYVSRETIETMASELTEESKSLHREIANTYNMLTLGVRKSHESYENRFSKIEVRAVATGDELHGLSTTVKHIQESLQSNHESINQLNAKLISLEHTLSDLENKVARVKNLTRRVPTGEIVGIELNDKHEHHFRAYKSKEGLARPHRTSRDFILGDRWIDLAEPED